MPAQSSLLLLRGGLLWGAVNLGALSSGSLRHNLGLVLSSKTWLLLETRALIVFNRPKSKKLGLGQGLWCLKKQCALWAQQKLEWSADRVSCPQEERRSPQGSSNFSVSDADPVRKRARPCNSFLVQGELRMIDFFKEGCHVQKSA